MFVTIFSNVSHVKYSETMFHSSFMPRKRLLVEPSYQSEVRYDSFDAKGTFEKEVSLPVRTIWDVAWECATLMRIVYENAKKCPHLSLPFDESKWKPRNPSPLKQCIFHLLASLYRVGKASLQFSKPTHPISLKVVYYESHLLTVDHYVALFQSIFKYYPYKSYTCCLSKHNELNMHTFYELNMHTFYEDNSFFALLNILFCDTARWQRDIHVFRILDFPKFMLSYERTFHCTILFSISMCKRIRRKIRETKCFEGKHEDILDIIVDYLLCF